MKRLTGMLRRKRVWIPAAMLLLLILALGFVLGTTAGARWIIGLAVGKAPVSVAVDRVEGRLTGPLHLYGIEVGTELAQVRVEHLELDWISRQILGRRLVIKRLLIEGVRAELLPAEPGPPPEDPGLPPRPLQPIELPLEIVVESARATDVHLVLAQGADLQDLQLSVRGRADDYRVELATQVVPAGGEPFPVEAEGRGSLRDFTLENLSAELAGGRILARARTTWYPDITWQASTELRQIHPGRLTPDPDRWPGRLDARLQSEGRMDAGTPSGWARLDSLRGEFLGLPAAGHLRADLQGPARVTAEGRLAWSSLELALTAALDDSIRADVNLACPDLAPLQAGLNGKMHLSGTCRGTRQNLRLATLFGAAGLTATDRAAAVDTLSGQAAVTLAATTDSTSLLSGWNLEDVGLDLWAGGARFREVALDSARLHADGNETDHRLRLQTAGPRLSGRLELGGSYNRRDSVWTGQLDGMRLAATPGGAWELQQPATASVGPGLLRLDRLRLAGKQAQIELTAALADSQWSADADIDHFPLGLANLVLPEDRRLRGQASARLETRGDLTGRYQVQAHLNVSDAALILPRQAPPDSLLLEALEITLDGGTRGLKGTLLAGLRLASTGGKADLDASIALPGFQTYRDSLPDEPMTLDLRGSISDLNLLQTLDPGLAPATGSLSLVTTARGTIGRPEVAAEVRLRQAAWQDTRIDSLTVSLNGSSANHLARIAGLGPDFTAMLELQGSLADSTLLWTGRLDSLRWDHPRSGAWGLEAPTPLAAGPGRVKIGDLALVGEHGHLDVNAALADSNWSANVSLAGLPLDLLGPFLPAHQRLTGQAAAQLQAEGDLQGGYRTDGRLDLAGASLIVTYEEVPDTLRFDPVHLAFDGGPGGLQAQLTAAVLGDRADRRADVQGRLALPGFRSYRDSLPGQPVQASVTGTIPDLGLLQGLDGRLTDTRGRVEFQLNVGGQVARPELGLALTVQDAGMTLPDLGVTIADIQLNTSGNQAAGYRLEGRARSGNGQITLAGSLPSTPSESHPITLDIKGDRFRLVNTPEVEAEASPDLHITYDTSKLMIGGALTLPRVQVEMVELPETAVAPSRDVRLLDVEQEASPPPVDTWVDLQVNLGDEVAFRGFAFAAKLTGSLRLQQHLPNPPTGHGEIRISEGFYRAYGQNLTVDSGVVSFAGPVENPALNVRAYRRAPDGVVAGVNVTGTAEYPELKIYSEPAMPETEAISYLLTGRPLDAGTGDDRARVAGTAALLGSNVLSSHLGSKLGLDEARVETGGEMSEAALVTGKYLSPQVYLSYAMGLFEKSNLVRLRYIFNPRWAVQAETGSQEGADLFYNIELGGGD